MTYTVNTNKLPQKLLEKFGSSDGEIMKKTMENQTVFFDMFTNMLKDSNVSLSTSSLDTLNELQYYMKTPRRSHCILSIPKEDFNNVCLNCDADISANTCIISSIHHPSKYEVNISKKPCLSCSYFILLYTNYLKDILYYMNHPNMKYPNLDYCVEATCEILCKLLIHYEIRRFILRHKAIFNRVVAILFAKGSCAHSSATFFCSPCHFKTSLLLLIEYGFNRNKLKWFLNANNGTYFKIMVIDEFINNKKQVLKAIHDVDMVYNDAWISYYVSVIFNIKVHKQYLLNAMKKYGNKNAVKYINKVLKICKSVSVETIQGLDWQILDAFRLYDVRKNIKCNNRKCRKTYFRHKIGLQDNTMNSFLSRMSVPKEQIRTWYKCKRCEMAYYCSKRCQKYDWNRFGHRTICDVFVKEI